MNYSCPNSNCLNFENGSNIAPDGSYFRPSDGRRIKRFRCKVCRKRFSQATFDPACGQNKRRITHSLKQLLCSGVSLRRAALLLKVSRKTVERRFIYLGELALQENQKFIEGLSSVTMFQFDDLQTIEHTKLKPLSVTLAVETETRKILGFEVSQMPATGHLAKLSRKKYGYRRDHRRQGIARLFSKLKTSIDSKARIISDEHPYYAPKVRSFFPTANHIQVKGARGCVAGQGELKKLIFDPLFILNHTCAMLRANINRLIRKTWCTTKLPSSLKYHLAIYMNFHNYVLTA
jgi:hypothetical protein